MKSCCANASLTFFWIEETKRVYVLDDTHLFTYQAAWAKFNTLSQNLSFKPNYNQLS